MELAEVIKKIGSLKGLNQKELANFLDINYETFNRNIKKNKLTGDLILSIAKNIPEIDLNDFIKGKGLNVLNEPGETYEQNSIGKINLAMRLLEEVKKEITRK